ncbi:MAG: prolyl oligopeptidase family serine peptidase [Betaproteobacteria bacterium]
MPHFPIAARHLAALLVCFAASAAFGQAKPPAPPGQPASDTYYGTTVADPMRALEDLTNPDVAAWMKAQADATRSTLDRIPQRAAILKEVQRYGDDAAARVTGVQPNNGDYYYLKRFASDNTLKLYMREGTKGKERLLVDPDKRAGSPGSHYAIDYFQPSPDNKYIAYGISEGGSEESVLHVLETATGKDTADAIDRANFASPSWLPDGQLMYSRLQKLGPGMPVTEKYLNQRAYLHRLGSNPDNDAALFGAGVVPGIALEPVENVAAGYVPGSSYVFALIVNGVQREAKLYAAPLASLAGDKTPWRKVVDYSDGVTDLAIHGDTIYLLSHNGAPHFKVLRMELAKPDIAAAQVVIPETDNVITGLAGAKDALYVRRMKGGISNLLRLDYAAGAKAAAIKLPFAGDMGALAADPRLPGALFEAGSWTRSDAWYAYDPQSGTVADTGLQPKGRYDAPADLVATEVGAPAKDGTLVPLSIVHKRGIKLDGNNPTLLYGYGAYGISQLPFYRPTFLPWFERGGILAVAHVRGGGENGEDWYKAGYKATKPNTWNDAIACAEWLVANKYTSPAKLAIWGGSAGGIFVGRSITDRPELFGAAIDQVPASDMLRFETTANGAPNVPEFGSVKTEEGFRALLAMSPYHHIKDGVKYPAVLVITGINDPRVDAWEATKMAARLQAASSSGKPVLLRIDYDAGHGIGSTKKQAYEERADIFAFLFWQFGVAGFQP